MPHTSIPLVTLAKACPSSNLSRTLLRRPMFIPGRLELGLLQSVRCPKDLRKSKDIGETLSLRASRPRILIIVIGLSMSVERFHYDLGAYRTQTTHVCMSSVTCNDDRRPKMSTFLLHLFAASCLPIPFDWAWLASQSRHFKSFAEVNSQCLQLDGRDTANNNRPDDDLI